MIFITIEFGPEKGRMVAEKFFMEDPMVGIGTDVDVDEAIREKSGLVSYQSANHRSFETAYS